MKTLILSIALFIGLNAGAQGKYSRADTNQWQNVATLPPYSTSSGWVYSLPETSDQYRMGDSVFIVKEQFRVTPNTGVKQRRTMWYIYFLPEERKTFFDQIMDSVERK